MTDLLFITGNKGKAHSAQVHLDGYGIKIENKDISLLEPQFDTIAEIAQFKGLTAHPKQ